MERAGHDSEDDAVLKVLERLVDNALVDAARVVRHRAEIGRSEQSVVPVTNEDIVRCATSLFAMAQKKLNKPDFMATYFGS